MMRGDRSQRNPSKNRGMMGSMGEGKSMSGMKSGMKKSGMKKSGMKMSDMKSSKKRMK